MKIKGYKVIFIYTNFQCLLLRIQNISDLIDTLKRQENAVHRINKLKQKSFQHKKNKKKIHFAAPGLLLFQGKKRN